MGFEPMTDFAPLPVFKTGAFSRTPPPLRARTVEEAMPTETEVYLVDALAGDPEAVSPGAGARRENLTQDLHRGCALGQAASKVEKVSEGA